MNTNELDCEPDSSPIVLRFIRGTPDRGFPQRWSLFSRRDNLSLRRDGSRTGDERAFRQLALVRPVVAFFLSTEPANC